MSYEAETSLTKWLQTRTVLSRSLIHSEKPNPINHVDKVLRGLRKIVVLLDRVYLGDEKRVEREFDLEHDHTSNNGESCEHDVVNRRNDRCVECIQCLGQHERETQERG